MVTGEGPGSPGLSEWLTPFVSPQGPPPYVPQVDLWMLHRSIVTHRNCVFPRLEQRLISELVTTSQLRDRKACYPAALGLYLFLSLPPIYLCSSRECCQVPSRWGRHCKSLIPKLILQQGTSSGQPSHSANTTCIFFLPQVCSISCRLPYPKVNYQIYCTFKKNQNTWTWHSTHYFYYMNGEISLKFYLTRRV